LSRGVPLACGIQLCRSNRQFAARQFHFAGNRFTVRRTSLLLVFIVLAIAPDVVLFFGIDIRFRPFYTAGTMTAAIGVFLECSIFFPEAIETSSGGLSTRGAGI
jgi:hypothetical protein